MQHRFSAISIILSWFFASSAHAYPIDCAILLCLPGGFPASAECAAAKAEMIRRITPLPVEPPLQPWRCPMQSAGVALPVSLGSDGLPAEVRGIRDSIEIYHVNFRQVRSRDDFTISDGTRVGDYGVSGRFEWDRSSFIDGPSWLIDASGVDQDRLGKVGSMSVRGVAMRWPDWQGNYATEWVPY